MNFYYETILGQELEIRRRKNDRYSARAFARALKIDIATLSRIISAKQIPSRNVAFQITERLKLSSEEKSLFLDSVNEARLLHVLSRYFEENGMTSNIRTYFLNKLSS